jgi:hypothetical protein
MRGLVAVALGVSLLAGGCATTEPLAPPAVDVTGTWSGTWHFEPESVGSGTISMTLVQKGAEVRGSLEVVGPTMHRPTRIEGIVTGDSFRVTGPITEGWIVVKGDQMTGELNGFVPVKMTAQRQR